MNKYLEYQIILWVLISNKPRSHIYLRFLPSLIWLYCDVQKHPYCINSCVHHVNEDKTTFFNILHKVNAMSFYVDIIFLFILYSRRWQVWFNAFWHDQPMDAFSRKCINSHIKNSLIKHLYQECCISRRYYSFMDRITDENKWFFTNLYQARTSPSKFRNLINLCYIVCGRHLFVDAIRSKSYLTSKSTLV